MRKIPYLITALLLVAGARAFACSNVIITRGASSDGSCMVSYAADSHVLYGELYFHPAAFAIFSYVPFLIGSFETGIDILRPFLRAIL